MLTEAGVDLWLDTLITGTYKEVRKITAVKAGNFSGKIRINGKCFVDASGCSILSILSEAKVFSEVNHITRWMLEMVECVFLINKNVEKLKLYCGDACFQQSKR